MVIICMLHSFFFNHKMETLLDCTRWQRFLWLMKKLSFELQKRAPALKVLPLWCDLELLKVSLAEERTCCFCVLLKSFSFACTLPVLGPPAAWCADWPWGFGVPLHVTRFTSQMLVCLLRGFSCVQLFATLWIVGFLIQEIQVHQAPLSMGFSRQEYWNVLPCPASGDLPDPRDQSTWR